MDSNSQDTKAEFRKLQSDGANRKYRKRSPVGGSRSSSSDGSPQRGRDDIPRRSVSKIAEDKLKRDDVRELNRNRGGESYKLSDRQSSRSYDRHNDQGRRDRHVNDYDRGYSKSSYRSGRDSRDMGYSRGDKEPRYRDYSNDVDKYPRETSDASGNRNRDKIQSDRPVSGRRHGNAAVRDRDKVRTPHGEDKDGHDRKIDIKSSVDQKMDRSSLYEDRDESYSRRDEPVRHLKEASQIDSKEPDGVKHANEEKRRRDDRPRYSEQRNRDPQEHSSDVKFLSNKDHDSNAKKPKVSGFESTAPETNGASEKAYVTDSDIDAAKVAAMRAAELVNKNLIGTGYMSTDQKKKLLWGNKKNATTEEPARHWNSANFGDQERQEKFKKLMGVKGHTKAESKLDDPNAEKQREKLQLELEKQYTAGLRRKDGRTVGLGL